MYSSDNAGNYPGSLSVLTPRYLKLLPTCPAAQKDSYSESYCVSASPDNFSMCCQGHHHKRSRTKADNPAYEGSTGLIDGKENY